MRQLSLEGTGVGDEGRRIFASRSPEGESGLAERGKKDVSAVPSADGYRSEPTVLLDEAVTEASLPPSIVDEGAHAVTALVPQIGTPIPAGAPDAGTGQGRGLVTVEDPCCEFK